MRYGTMGVDFEERVNFERLRKERLAKAKRLWQRATWERWFVTILITCVTLREPMSENGAATR